MIPVRIQNTKSFRLIFSFCTRIRSSCKEVPNGFAYYRSVPRVSSWALSPRQICRFVFSDSCVHSPQTICASGDFILTHSTGVFGQLIRFGQHLRYTGSEKVFAHWSHAAIVVNDSGDIIEALGGGVQKRNISV